MRGWRTGLTLGGLTAALLLPGSSADARFRTRAAPACSVRGLHFFSRSGSATYSEKVVALSATHVRCATARSLASTVAKDLLHSRKVPAVIHGLRVRVSRPCQSCMPVWHVTATGKGEWVKFTARGRA